MSHAVIEKALNDLSRYRELTEAESRVLEQAIRSGEESRRRLRKFWTNKDLSKAETLRAKGLTYIEIARKVGRTPDAVAARLRYNRELAGAL